MGYLSGIDRDDNSSAAWELFHREQREYQQRRSAMLAEQQRKRREFQEYLDQIARPIESPYYWNGRKTLP